MRTLDVEITGPCDDPILAPTGTATRHQATTRLPVFGGRIEAVAIEPELGLGAALIKPEGGSAMVRYNIEDHVSRTTFGKRTIPKPHTALATTAIPALRRRWPRRAAPSRARRAEVARVSRRWSPEPKPASPMTTPSAGSPTASMPSRICPAD